MEGGLGSTEIEACVEGLNGSEIFFVVKEVLGFILYMHNQIPAVLQDLEDEFDGLKEQYKQMDLSHTSQGDQKDRKVSLQRKNNMRKTEMKSSIKRMEKLMNSITLLLSALQEAISETPNFHGVALVLGGSLARPQYVYEMMFSHVRHDDCNGKNSCKSKAAEVLSRKAVRALISNGAGSSSNSGSTKLFMLIKCPCTFSLPMHFLPRRDFRYNKRVLPMKLQVNCKMVDEAVNDLHGNFSSANSIIDDIIWYQCRHTVKGLTCKSQDPECC